MRFVRNLHQAVRVLATPTAARRSEFDAIEKIKLEVPMNGTLVDPFNERISEYSSSETSTMMPFDKEIAEKLLKAVNPADIEVKPDGILYVPEIKYRRALSLAFGPGGWGLVPKSPHCIIEKSLSREYALYCHGRFVAQARGEQDFFSQDQLLTATEGVKSNAMMRCCKDLGIYWELWDPKFIKDFKSKHVEFVEGVHVKTGQTKWIWRKKGAALEYPYRQK